MGYPLPSFGTASIQTNKLAFNGKNCILPHYRGKKERNKKYQAYKKYIDNCAESGAFKNDAASTRIGATKLQP